MANFFLLYKFPLDFGILHFETSIIDLITPHGPDDGSVELKRYSVYFSINLSFHLDYLVINFSQHIYVYKDH